MIIFLQHKTKSGYSTAIKKLLVETLSRDKLLDSQAKVEKYLLFLTYLKADAGVNLVQWLKQEYELHGNRTEFRIEWLRLKLFGDLSGALKLMVLKWIFSHDSSDKRGTLSGGKSLFFIAFCLHLYCIFD